MTEQLKTQRDIWDEFFIWPKVHTAYEVKMATNKVFEDHKKEAIKWAKLLNKAIRDNNPDILPEQLQPAGHIADWKGQCASIITWIRIFFSVTAEELK